MRRGGEEGQLVAEGCSRGTEGRRDGGTQRDQMQMSKQQFSRAEECGVHVSTPAESDQTLLPLLRGTIMKREVGRGIRGRGGWQGGSKRSEPRDVPFIFICFVFFLFLIGRGGARQRWRRRPTCMTMRRSKTRMKEARKALETSSLGRKPRFRLSQLIQSVLMTSSTNDVREMSTVLWGVRDRGGRGRGKMVEGGSREVGELGEKDSL